MEEGEDKLVAAVRHIAKSLGRTQTMADDILQVFSSFDNRFLALDKTYERRREAVPVPAADPQQSPSRSPLAALDRTLRTLERQIPCFVDSNGLIWSNSTDAAAFLETVDFILDTVTDINNQAASPATKRLLERADHLLHRCVLRLDEEFRSIIEPPHGLTSENYDNDDSNVCLAGDDEPIPVAKPVDAYDIVIDALPPGSVADLNDIARRMVATGFGRECVETYTSYRRGFVEESIARLGLCPPPADGFLAMPWEEMENEIPRWIEAARMIFLILIPSERRLCDRVFASVPAYADLAFSVSCLPAVVEFISFAAAAASGDQGPERLFGLLDLYESIRDLLPELDAILSDRHSADVLTEVGDVYRGLGASVRRIFMGLENRIRRDPAKSAVPGGDVHPITRYVTNYLAAACSRPALSEAMVEEASSSAVPLPVRVAWITDILLDNLDAKSRIYHDRSLAYIFLMNNGRYIIEKAAACEIGSLLGEDWIRRLKSKVQQWGSEYQRAAWSKVMAAMRIDGLGGAGSSAAATDKAIKDKLMMFNNYLVDIWKTQGNWVAVDEQMRSELRATIMAAVLPAYQNMVRRLRQVGDARWIVDRHLKYKPEDVQAMINELFEGGRRIKGGQ